MRPQQPSALATFVMLYVYTYESYALVKCNENLTGDLALWPGDLALSCNPSYLEGQSSGMVWGGKIYLRQRMVFQDSTTAAFRMWAARGSWKSVWRDKAWRYFSSPSVQLGKSSRPVFFNQYGQTLLLKRQSHEIFDLHFLINRWPLGPW
jgi:hypothetical protein